MKEVVSPVLTLDAGDYTSDHPRGRLWICARGLNKRFEKRTLGRRIRVHVVPRPSKWTITITLLYWNGFKDAITKGRQADLFPTFYDFLTEANDALGMPPIGPTHFWVEVLED
jgi:hypothetical protein